MEYTEHKSFIARWNQFFSLAKKPREFFRYYLIDCHLDYNPEPTKYKKDVRRGLLIALLFAWNFWQLIAFIATMWIFWEILIRVWEKINFAFSVDWFLVKITQLLTGQKMARLNLKPIIYGPNQFRNEYIKVPTD